MTIKHFFIAALCLAASTSVFAGKIAVFDHQAAISQTKQAKKSIEKLQKDSEYVQIVEQVKGYESDLKALAKEAESKGVTWSQEQAAEHRKKIEFIQADRQLAVKKLQSEHAALEQQLMQDILPKLQEAIKKIAAEMDIDVVLKPQAVYFAVPELDITKKVTDELNKAK